MKQGAKPELWKQAAEAALKKENRLRVLVGTVVAIGILIILWDALGEKPKMPTALKDSPAARSTSGPLAARTAPTEAVQSLAPQTLLPQLAPESKHVWRADEELGENEFVLLGYGLRGTVLTAEEWEGLDSTSMDYRMADSAFRKQDLLNVMKPKLQARMDAFKSRDFVVDKPVYLGPYDMERKAFPLRPDAAQSALWSLEGHWGYIKGENFDLVISNSERFENYAVADEQTARRLDALSVSKRSGHAKVYLFAEDVTPDGRIVTAKITGLELSDYDGRPMGVLGLAK